MTAGKNGYSSKFTCKSRVLQHRDTCLLKNTSCRPQPRALAFRPDVRPTVDVVYLLKYSPHEVLISQRSLTMTRRALHAWPNAVPYGTRGGRRRVLAVLCLLITNNCVTCLMLVCVVLITLPWCSYTLLTLTSTVTLRVTHGTCRNVDTLV